MKLETRRMCIRNFMLEDAEDLYAILGDAETMVFCQPPYDLDKTKYFLKTFCIQKKGAVAAVHKESGRVIGYILLNELSPGEYEIGWFFHRSFWRQGYAYEACKALMDYVFDVQNANKIFAETTDPVKSVNLMKKLGMHPEGIQSTQGVDGTQTDLYLFGLLKEERNTP